MSREGVQTLRMWPWRDGLATAGQQSSIPETAMWQCKDVSAGLDGMLQKRPGLRKWGQTIKEPVSTAADKWIDGLLDESLPNWTVDDQGGGLVTYSVRQGILTINTIEGAGNETLSLGNQLGTSVLEESSVRFTFQGINLQPYTPASTNANTFHFRIAQAGVLNFGYEFAVWQEGLYYRATPGGTYTLVQGTSKLGTGAWATIEVRLDQDGNTLFYLDETLVDTVATSNIASVLLNVNSSKLEFSAEVDSAEKYTVKIIAPMWVDQVADPFETFPVTAVADFTPVSNSGVLSNSLMAAAGRFIYHDTGLFGAWRPIERKTYSNVFFTTFRKQVCWIENNGIASSKVWLWTGVTSDAPVEQEEAPLARFGAEHQTRLWLAGDRRNPLRAYYSGDRQPNVWFAPAQNSISNRFDTQINAGYLEVPGRRGDEITAIWGDYYGQLLIFTKRAVYRVTGSGTSSYAIQTVSQDVGCINELSVTQVGNDIWFLSNEGVHSLATSEKFGDLIKGFASGPIQDLWGGDPSTVRPISKTNLGQSRMAYNRTLGLVYVAVPLLTDTTASNVFIYNTTSESWYGPWEIDSLGLASVEIASPVVDVVMHSNAQGVFYTDTLRKSDDGTAISSVIESAMLNGRSLDPALVGRTKTWKRMRVYVLPRGDWDLKLFWRTDSDVYQEVDPNNEDQNKTQNKYKRHGLTTEFRLDEDPDGRLASRESLAYIEVIVDKRGYNFAFKIEQDGNGEDFAIQGIEVDFTINPHERN
jgi:hypothetical protein